MKNNDKYKYVSAKDALKAVHSGMRIFLGSNVAVPKVLARELGNFKDQLDDVEIVHILTTLESEFVENISSDNFHHTTFFVGKDTRKAVAEGNADYIPIFLSEIPDLFKRGQVHLDVAMIQVSTPDEHGFCSYGVGVDIVKAAAECADVVIAQVNPCMPRTLGNSFIHSTDIDYMVLAEEALDEAIYPAPDEISKKIGYLVSTLIEDGSTLQMGIGSIPNAVLDNLDTRKDLGVHTEMFSDGLLSLIEKGAITNSKKGLHDGKVITSFCMGSRRLYDFVDNNPLIEFHPSDYVNNPINISKNHKMISINSALEVDLSGQVCADSIGNMVYSGIGGQVDFVRGAAMSYRGKSIIALPSTAKHGSLSRIKAHLTSGAGVVTSRGDVHYIVTEHGIAYLHGKSLRERAIALIAVAHPDFREALYQESLELGILHPHQTSPFTTDEYPVQYEEEKTFKNLTLQIRPIKPTDARMLQEFFYSHDNETIYNRYHNMKKAMHAEEAQERSTINYRKEMAIVAIRQNGQGEEIIAVSRYINNPRRNCAEMAIVIHQDYRGKKIGSFMYNKIATVAKDCGIKSFIGYVQLDNAPMLSLLKKTSAKDNCQVEFTNGSYRFEYKL